MESVPLGQIAPIKKKRRLALQSHHGDDEAMTNSSRDVTDFVARKNGVAQNLRNARQIL
jgi:hypothetical protein